MEKSHTYNIFRVSHGEVRSDYMKIYANPRYDWLRKLNMQYFHPKIALF